MRTTTTLSGAKAMEAIKKGVNAIYEPVRATFGPKGRNVLLYRTMNRGNRITNDGVTVAECIEPKNQQVRMAAQTFKESCKKTNEKVGDGTTCTTILAGKLFNEIYKQTNESKTAFVGSDHDVISLKNDILKAAKDVKEQITKVSKKIKTLKDLEKVATISVEDEDLGKLVAKMAWDVGVDGFIDVVEGYKGEIETEVIKGMRFSAKVPAKVFVNNPNRYEMVVKDSPIIITNYAMDNVGSFVHAFKELGTSKLVVVAPSFSENVMVNFVNAGKNGFFIHPILAPSLRTPQLEDLSVYCGANFIDKAQGKKLQNIKPEDMGFIEKIVVKDSELKEDAIITGGRGASEIKNPVVKDEEGLEIEEPTTPVQERLEILKSQLVETKQPQFKKLLERRIASMASAVGVIKVGDSTEASSLYQKLKIEDAVYACKAALRGGYVKGGGLCLKEIADKLPEGNVLKTTLLAPYEQIQSGGSMEIGDDVIDPAEAIYYAVEHATQVIAHLITVDSMIAEQEDPVHGEGEFAIARALHQMMITQKIEKGQIKAGMEEQLLDSQGGLNDDEFLIINQD